MQAELEAFQSSGFFVSSQPLLPPETIALIDQLQKEVEPEWMQTEFPPGCNRLACQFLMVMRRGGEELLKIVEAPATLALAAALLEVDDHLDGDMGADGAAERVVLEACGMGDTFDLLECNQIGWHSDSSDLAFRTVLDPQGPGTGNAGLRVLPGSASRPREDVSAELREIEDATDLDNSMTDQGEGGLAAPHPAEILVPLDTTMTLIWSPTTWHATERQSAGAGRRRAFGWNYGRAAGNSRQRDVEAVRHVFAGAWEAWPAARKRLWGLVREEAKPRL